MTREDFKDLAMGVIAHRSFMKDWTLFDSAYISDYGVVEYDDDGYNSVANGMPLEEFLDDLYEEIIRQWM